MLIVIHHFFQSLAKILKELKTPNWLKVKSRERIPNKLKLIQNKIWF